MALNGIVTLADRLVNQSQPTTVIDQDATNSTPVVPPASPSATTIAAAHTSDDFTSSIQTSSADATAQAAGLFSVATLSLFSAAAKFLLGNKSAAGSSNFDTTPVSSPTGEGNAGASPVDPTAQTLPDAPGAGAPSTTNLLAASSAASTAQASTAPTAANGDVPAPSASAIPTVPPSSVAQSASANSELQSLNAALSALGLPQDDIAVIDRIASLLGDFSPAAYTDLLHQLESLAQNQSPPSAAATGSLGATTAPATTSTSASSTNLSIAVPSATLASPSASAVPKASGATGGTFQVRELVIRFAGTEETRTSSQKNGTTAGTASTAAFNLQAREVTLTLKNGSGQSTNIHAPRIIPAANSAKLLSVEAFGTRRAKTAKV